MPDYMAPARYALTEVHERDPAVAPAVERPGSPATEGATKCGLPMVCADLWQLVELLPGDHVCSACEAPGSVPADQQDSLL